jgi:cobalt-zinc-cadmium efflux system membrane fusion protein
VVVLAGLLVISGGVPRAEELPPPPVQRGPNAQIAIATVEERNFGKAITSSARITAGRQGRLWVLAEVKEPDLSQVKVGSPVRVTVATHPDKVFIGEVDVISGAIDPVTHTATVRCVFDNSAHLLEPDTNGSVAIETQGRKALAIPRAAVLHLGDKATVIVVNMQAGRYERRTVVVDELEMGDWVPVLSGLEPGAKILSEGAQLVSEILK